MSKTGVSSTPTKQDNNQFKKDSRGQSNNTQSSKDDKRSSDSFTSHGGRSHGHQGSQPQGHGRDRSENRNESRNYDKNAPETKTNDKEDKSSSDQATSAASEKKFTGRCRLFVGNLTPDVTEEEFRKMFEAYGEISEVYVNTSRGFGFIRLVSLIYFDSNCDRVILNVFCIFIPSKCLPVIVNLEFPAADAHVIWKQIRMGSERYITHRTETSGGKCGSLTQWPY